MPAASKKSMKAAAAAKPSTKIKAKAKATPKAKAKPAVVTVESTAAACDSVVLYEPKGTMARGRSIESTTTEPKCDSERRKLRKRDSSEQAHRVLTARLAGVSETVIEHKLNASGETMIEVTKKAMKQAKHSQEYLATEFWTDLDDAFNIFSHSLDCLPDAPDNEIIQDENCHSKNRATRNTKELQRFLEYASPLNESELMTVLNASVRGLIVSPKMEREMRHALLKHMGTHGLHLKFVALWEAIKDLMDSIVADHWAVDQSTGVLRGRYLKGESACALLAVIDLDAALRVEVAVRAKESPSVADLNLLLGSQTGRALYRPEGLKVSFMAFIESCSKFISELEDNGFKYDDVEAFKREMKCGTTHLSSIGVSNGMQPIAQVPYLTLSTMALDVEHLNEHWDLRKKCRVETLAVHLGLVPRMPWEIALYGPTDVIPGFPLTVVISDGELKQIRNAREHAAEVMGDGLLTFKEMSSYVNEANDALVGLDRLWVVNKVFINKHAEPVAMRSVHMHILAALPSESNTEVSFDEAMVALLTLKASRLVLCCKASVLRELTLFTAIVKDLMDGNSPCSKEVVNFNPFFRLGLSRLAYFCKYKVLTAATAGQLFPKATILVAQDAIIEAYRDFANAVEAKESPKTVGLCRQFSWMLSSSQLASLEKYVKDFATQQRLAHAPLLKALKDAKGGGDDSVSTLLLAKPVAKSGASSSSTGPLTPGPKGKLANAEESLEDKKSRLRELYAPKKKAA
jgi:hypothetical protein